MKSKLLISGERPNFTILEIDLAKKALYIVAHYAAPFNSSWIELSSSKGDIDFLIGLSEGVESGLLYTFEVDHGRKAFKITSQQPTLGAPGHCEFSNPYYSLGSGINTARVVITLRDNSGLALGTVSLCKRSNVAIYAKIDSIWEAPLPSTPYRHLKETLFYSTNHLERKSCQSSRISLSATARTKADNNNATSTKYSKTRGVTCMPQIWEQTACGFLAEKG